MRQLAMVLAVLPSMVWAGDWQKLDGAAISATLAGQVLGYEDGATQEFRASGATSYTSGGSASTGRWRVTEDRYCSVWPPSELWACYDLETDGISLRFVADDGSRTVGRNVTPK